MNVLILTPDRVGSTLLQRLVTVAMCNHDYKKPVINLHELTNGLELYYSTVFNQQVLGKPQNRPWGYYQSLEEIVQLLESTDHIKTSRLAHYHLINRGDTIKSLFPFYEYLNKNFYIISCRRNNLFEHLLSWCINIESRKLNVYSHEEKIQTFGNIYKNKIYVDLINIDKYLTRYKDYISWVDNVFQVNRYFVYDKDLPNIEQFVDDLPIFPEKNKSWKESYGISWNDWNKCHHLLSDMSGISKKIDQLSISTDKPLQLIYTASTELATLKEVSTSLSVSDNSFLNNNKNTYLKVYQQIAKLEKNRNLISKIPIKLQTLVEKVALIKNFEEVVIAYNQWVIKNEFGNLVDYEVLSHQAIEELQQYYIFNNGK